MRQKPPFVNVTIFHRQGLVCMFPICAFAQAKVSKSSADILASAGNLLIFWFGCAAYRLLFKQTRAMRSNSVFKAIAMLTKPAKIFQRSALGSEDICTLIKKNNELVQMRISHVSFLTLFWTACQTKNIIVFSAKSQTCIAWENTGVFCLPIPGREGYYSQDIWRNFRSFFEQSGCSRRIVWALCASLRQEQSISGAEKARKSTCLGCSIPPNRYGQAETPEVLEFVSIK